MENSEIKKGIEEKVAKVGRAFGELLACLIDEGLFQNFKDRTAPLDEEDREIDRQLEDLERNHQELAPVIQSKIRVCERQIDELMAKSNLPAVERKKEEITNAQHQLDSILEKAGVFGERQEAIPWEKKTIGKDLFEQVYPLVTQSTLSAIEMLLDFLDKTWEGLERYEGAIGMIGLENTDSVLGQGLLRSYHRENLTPNSASNRPLYARLRAWLG